MGVGGGCQMLHVKDTQQRYIGQFSGNLQRSLGTTDLEHIPFLTNIRSHPLPVNSSIHRAMQSESHRSEVLVGLWTYGDQQTSPLPPSLSSDRRWLILISVSLTGAISLGEEAWVTAFRGWGSSGAGSSIYSMCYTIAQTTERRRGRSCWTDSIGSVGKMKCLSQPVRPCILADTVK